MQTCTAAFDTAARATIRRSVARVQITWTDPYIDTSIAITANDENRISWADQTANLNTIPTHKWAHLDSTLKPDGTFYPCPSTSTEAADNEMGWWGAVESGVGGAFSVPYPTLTTTFAARPVLGLRVVGNSIYNEYPVDFVIKVYNASNTLLHTHTVTANALLEYAADLTSYSLNAAAKMTLAISKWSTASRVVKITEFYTDLIETYENEDIVDLNLLEEREIRDSSIPVGNISANELDLELQNIKIFANGAYVNDPLFPANTNSYLHAVVKKNRRVKAWIGFELADTTIEYIPLGTFWSDDWSISDTDFAAKTSCRDRMELLRKATFSGSELYENVTLYTLAETVLDHARLNIPMYDLKWSIDTELQNYSVRYAWFPKKNYMQTIKDIVSACMGQAYMSRGDVLIIEGPSATELTTTTAGA